MSLLPKTITATIANGASLSGAICLGAGTLCAIQMSAAWTAADITFQVSDDQGTTWYDLRDDAGVEVKITSPTAAYRLEPDASAFKSAVFLKIRSGTSASPVNQGAARTLTVVARKFSPEV